MAARRALVRVIRRAHPPAPNEGLKTSDNALVDASGGRGVAAVPRRAAALRTAKG